MQQTTTEEQDYTTNTITMQPSVHVHKKLVT